jgi:hypothetical protein
MSDYAEQSAMKIRRAPHAFRIEATMTHENLIVRFRCQKTSETVPSIRAQVSQIERRTLRLAKDDSPQSCASCGVQECFRHRPTHSAEKSFGRAAYLIDEHWAKYDAYISAQAKTDDLLCLPLDAKRFRKANYAWNTARFGQVHENRLFCSAHCNRDDSPRRAHRDHARCSSIRKTWLEISPHV